MYIVRSITFNLSHEINSLHFILKGENPTRLGILELVGVDDYNIVFVSFEAFLWWYWRCIIYTLKHLEWLDFPWLYSDFFGLSLVVILNWRKSSWFYDCSKRFTFKS